MHLAVAPVGSVLPAAADFAAGAAFDADADGAGAAAGDADSVDAGAEVVAGAAAAAALPAF